MTNLFTPINAGTDWQKASVTEELTLGFIERNLAADSNFLGSPFAANTAYAVNQIVYHAGTLDRCTTAHTSDTTGVMDPTKFEHWFQMTGDDGNGKDLQGRIFGSGVGKSDIEWPGWRTMQTGLKAPQIYSKFIDSAHVPGIDGTFSTAFDLTEFAYESDTQVYVRAGMDTRGYRRATVWNPAAIAPKWEDDINFSYGLMEAGDIIGPWIFEDLQSVLSVYRYTAKVDKNQKPDVATWRALNSVQFKTLLTRDGPSGSGDTVSCNVARQEHIDSWGNYNWVDTGASAYYNALGRYTHTTGWFMGADRMRSAPAIAESRITPIADLTHGWAVYVKPDNGDTDMDGLGMHERTFYLHDEGVGVNAGAAFNADTIGNIATDPITLPAGPEAPSCPIESTKTIVCNEAYWLIDWDFTNSNN